MIMIDSCVRGSHFSNLLVFNYCLAVSVSAKNGTSMNFTVQLYPYSLTVSFIGTTDGKQGLPTILWPHLGDVPPHRHMMPDPRPGGQNK